MAEISTSTYKQTSKILEEVFTSMKTLKKKMRILNANMVNIHDIGVHEDRANEIQNILDRKTELASEGKDVIRLIDECRINMEKIGIDEVQRREKKGRCNGTQDDSGFISEDLENSKENDVLRGLQEITPHAHPEFNINSPCDDQKNVNGETYC